MHCFDTSPLPNKPHPPSPEVFAVDPCSPQWSPLSRPPFQGVLFGLVADHYGRQPAVLGSLYLMCFATLGQGLTPPVPKLGPIWLIVSRALQGVALGGVPPPLSPLSPLSSLCSNGREIRHNWGFCADFWHSLGPLARRQCLFPSLQGRRVLVPSTLQRAFRFFLPGEEYC